MSADGPAKHTRRGKDSLIRKPLHNTGNGSPEKSNLNDSIDSNSSSKSPRMPHKQSTSSPRFSRKQKRKSPKNELYPTLSDISSDDSDTNCDQTDNSFLAKKGKTSPDKKNQPSVGDNSLKNRKKSKADVRLYPNLKDIQKKDLKANNTSTCTNKLITGLVVFILVCVVVGCIYLFQQSPPSQDQETSTQAPIDYFRHFKPGFDQVQSQYPSQSSRFWKTISAAIRRVLNDPIPSYPAVVMLGVPKGQSDTATCFSKEILRKLNEVFKSEYEMYIDSADLSELSPAKAKLKLDDNLKDILSHSRGVVLDHIDMLDAKMALLLHGYCDGDNAPFKNAVIILVLQTEKFSSDLDDRSVDGILSGIWGDGLGVDEMPALVSRIANNVAILKPEEGITCERG